MTEGPYIARLSQYERALWYDFVLYPAVKTVLSAKSHYWPPSYANYLFKSRRVDGTLVLAPIQVQQEDVPLLLAEMRRIIGGIGGSELLRPFRGFGLYWEIRDEKHATCKEFNVQTIETQMEAILPSLLRHFRHQELIDHLTEIDVAVEYSLPDRSLYIRKASHSAICTTVLGLPKEKADVCVTKKSQGARYQFDPVAGIGSLGGFHMNFKGKKAPTGVAYAQFYHADKTLRYQSAGPRKQVPLLPKWILTPAREGRRGFASWCEATDDDLLSLRRHRVPTIVRAEVSVKPSLAAVCLPLFHATFIETACVALPIEAMM